MKRWGWLAVPAALVLAWGCGEPVGESAAPVAQDQAVDVRLAPFTLLALDCVDREYPNNIAHSMRSDADLAPPRGLHPAFYGCFDWHSAVHGHWLLAAAYFSAEDGVDRPLIADVFDRHFTADAVAAEVAYLDAEGRASWERPYGLAWLLQLAAELRAHDDPDARRWSAALRPLEDACAERFLDWLPKLAYPIRTGEHSQTAFALGMALDYARVAGRKDLALLIETKAREFHLREAGATLAFEPSGQDFLSPVLGVADLMTRVLPPAAYARWLRDYLPEIPSRGGAAWLPVAVVTDRADGKLAHLDGLNLSRAWMLRRMAAALPVADARRPALLAAAATHADDALASLTGEHYEGGHWLGSFAAYLAQTSADRDPQREAVLALRSDLWRADTTRARARLADDPRQWWETRRGAGQAWTLGRGRWTAWDEHFRGRNRILLWEPDRADDPVAGSVRVSFIVEESNDFYALTGRGPQRYRQAYWIDRETGAITGTMIQGLHDQAPEPGLMPEFAAWAEANRAEEWAELAPRGRVDPSGDHAPRMRALLEAWRTESGLPAVD